jgi:hypothetical protein
LRLVAAADARSRFDPAFRNDLHPPRAADAEIVRLLRESKNGDSGPPDRLALVHGHFLDDGRENVVVATFSPIPGGDETRTLLFSKGAGGWTLRSRYEALNVAYCRVIPVSASKDILLCQTNFAGPSGRYGEAEVDTNLYAVDFTRDPADSWFFQLRDTVSTGARCLSWANAKSVNFGTGTLHVEVEYGRKQLPQGGKADSEFKKMAAEYRGSPPGFPHQLYDIEFRILPGEWVPAERSLKDFDFITAPWEKGGCPAGQSNGQGRECHVKRSVLAANCMGNGRNNREINTRGCGRQSAQAH